MTLDVDQKYLGKRMREHIKSKAGIRICGVIQDRSDAVRGIARHMHSGFVLWLYVLGVGIWMWCWLVNACAH
jgi:hypothetical protein